MSAWGKVLAPIVVPTGQQIGWEEAPASSYTANITAGTYATILELMAHVAAVMTAGANTYAATVSEVGIVSIVRDTGTTAWESDWTNTSAWLIAALGSDETETVSGVTLTMAAASPTGWYPGVTSFGASSGASETGDSDWTADWPKADGIAGTGKLHRVGPPRAAWRRQLSWDLLKGTEVLDPDRGVHALQSAFIDKIRYYPDRSVGVVGTVGTQGDPQDDPRDSETDYWAVSIMIPEWQLNANGASYRSLDLELHGDPD